MDISIVSYYGIQASRCGYCKGTKCSKAHGMHAYTMTPQDYQDLIDRGWRRSGDYCYKPNNSTTLHNKVSKKTKEKNFMNHFQKCDALEFKLTKSHKKILKRMNRFLRDGKKDKNEECADGKIVTADLNEMGEGLGMHDEPKAPHKALPTVDVKALENENLAKHEKKSVKCDVPTAAADIVDGAVAANAKPAATSDKQMPPPPRKKAKQMRLERREAKRLANCEETSEAALKQNKNKNLVKSLADFIAETTPADKHKLKIVLKPAASLKVETQTFDLYRKYQMNVHNDTPERLTPTRLERFLYKTPLKLTLIHVRTEEFRKTLPESYKLYEKYQTLIHKDPPENLEDFLTFLGRSPLKLDLSAAGPPQGYGSFHQQYWLDDKLIAVGVIDILPHCLSSVYFFYDPDYSFLSLGTYASLRELEFVQQLSEIVPALKYYYMGFYIQSCPKMRYKGKLVPSYLLCPETYTWQLLTDEIRSRLDVCKYQRFNTDANAKDQNEFTENDLNNVLLLLERNKFAKYGQCVQLTGEEFDAEERDMIMEYGKLVGKICAHRMIYVNM